jgi:mannose-6-phosphate isomerase-like protein (cupin superfamily)
LSPAPPGQGLDPGEAGEYWFEEGCHILELLNDPADPDLSIARARVPAGGTTRWHRLRDTVERYLVQSGQGLVEVGTAAPRRVGVGDVVLIPAGERQRIHNPGPDDLVFLALCTPRFETANYMEDEPAGGRHDDGDDVGEGD